MSASQLFAPSTSKIDTAQWISPMTAPLECSLSRAGIAQITPGSSQVTVSFAGVTNASVILATYHLDAGVAIDATATAVDAVECGVNNFVIKLNAAATASVKVAWLVASL